MDNYSASPGTTNSRITFTAIARYLALLGAILASFVISPLTADAVEFPPDPPIPVIQVDSNCGDGGIFTTVKLTNVGSGTATFHFVVTINGIVFVNDLQVASGADPAGPIYKFLEGQVVSVQITSTDGAGATASLSFDPVHCQPFHLKVSNKVVGGSGNPTFDFQVVCTPINGVSPDYVMAKFSLHDGENATMDLPMSDSCAAREVDPGAGWTVTRSVNGQEFSPPDLSTLQPSMDLTVDFLNTSVTPPPDDSSTTIPTTTLPTTTIPTTTIPTTTIPTTTVSTLPTVNTVPAAGIIPVGASAATDPGPLATQLPATGSSNAAIALIALVLLGAGSALIGLARRHAAT